MTYYFQEHVSSELNPAIQEWMRSVAIRHLNDYINNNNTVQNRNTENYIIRSDVETAVNSSIASDTGMEQNNSNEESIEVENVDFSDALSELEDALNSNNSTVNMETSYNELPSVVIGTESWHSSVPRDWVK